MIKKNTGIIILIAVLIGFVCYQIYAKNERDKENDRLEAIRAEERRKEFLAQQEEEKRKQEAQRIADSITAAINERKRIEEERRMDSIAQLENEQVKVEHITFAVNRINLFGEKYMKDVSPVSGEGLEIIIDTASLTYDYLTKITIIPFEVKWNAYKYGIFRNESGKSLHDYEGKFTLMGNYDEYIETTYQNSSLQEGIKSNVKFSNTMRDLSNIAEILDKADKIDKALKKDN